MSISDWPLKERPRERLLKLGADALSNAELLAIFLRTGIRGKTALDLARDLLNHFGSLRGLMEATQGEFCQHRGLGTAKFAQLQAAKELSNRCIHEDLQQGSLFSNAKHIKQYVISQLRHHQREVFACLFFDGKNKFLCFEILFYGSLNSTTIHAREVVKRALACNAASVIFAHNHPSGHSAPSLDDKQVTECLKNALAWVDIRVLDHLVVGNNTTSSFLELGFL